MSIKVKKKNRNNLVVKSKLLCPVDIYFRNLEYWI